MLDCETPRGRDAIAREEALIGRLCMLWRCEDLKLPPAARVDRVLYRDGSIVATIEVKSRAITHAELEEYGSLLISNRKLLNGGALAGVLGVPFLVAVGTIDSIVWWMVHDGMGRVVYPHVRKMETQATCNGGFKLDEVALLELCLGTREEWV